MLSPAARDPAPPQHRDGDHDEQQQHAQQRREHRQDAEHRRPTSSANDSTGLPAPAVSVVEAGRTVARVACSEPAVTAPSANRTIEGMSVGVSAEPANRIAPDAGCTTEPIACSRLSTRRHLVADEVEHEEDAEHDQPRRGGERVVGLGELELAGAVEQARRQQRDPGVEPGRARQAEGGGDVDRAAYFRVTETGSVHGRSPGARAAQHEPRAPVATRLGPAARSPREAQRAAGGSRPRPGARGARRRCRRRGRPGAGLMSTVPVTASFERSGSGFAPQPASATAASSSAAPA